VTMGVLGEEDVPQSLISNPSGGSCWTPVDAGFSPWMVWVDGFQGGFPCLFFLWGAEQGGSEWMCSLQVECSCHCIEEGRHKLMTVTNVLVRGKLMGMRPWGLVPLTVSVFCLLRFEVLPSRFHLAKSDWSSLGSIHLHSSYPLFINNIIQIPQGISFLITWFIT
jgi:hypothetical protein